MTSLRVLLPVAILVLAGCAGGPPAAEDGTTTTRATTEDREPTTVETTSPRTTTTPTTPTATPVPDLTATRDCGSPDTTPSVPAVGANGSPGVAVKGVTARPGETVNVSVTARNVGEMHFRLVEGDVIGWPGDRSAEFAPRWDQVYPTIEPYWEWDPVEPEVTAELSVRVAADADPGTYCDGTVYVWNDTDHDHDGGARARFVVHVSNGTDDR